MSVGESFMFFLVFVFCFCFKLKCLFLWLLLTFCNCELLYHVTGKALERTSGLGPCPPALPPLPASLQTGTRGQQAFPRLFCGPALNGHNFGHISACRVMLVHIPSPHTPRGGAKRTAPSPTHSSAWGKKSQMCGAGCGH